MHKRARHKANRYFFYKEVAKQVVKDCFTHFTRIQDLVLGLQCDGTIIRNNAKLTLKFIRKSDKKTYNEVINELQNLQKTRKRN
mgnify:CR=1 FL=1